MSRPRAHGFWNRLLCGMGLHKKIFSFGWDVSLDGSFADGYTGTFFCERCGKILNGKQRAGKGGRLSKD